MLNLDNRYKFVAAVFMLFLLPFLIMSRHFIYGKKAVARLDTLNYMEMKTRTVADVTADILALKYNISDMVSSADFINGSTEARKKMLEKRLQGNPGVYSEFSVLNSAGKEQAKVSAGVARELKDLSDSTLFKNARDTRQAAGAVEFGQYTPPALLLMEPYTRGAEAKPEYYVMARMSLAYLGAVMRVVGRSSNGSMGIVDAGGQLITDSLGRSIINPGIQAPEEVLQAVEAAVKNSAVEFKTEVMDKGAVYLISVANIAGTHWWVFEMVDARNVLGHASAARAKRIIWIGVILMFAFSLVAYKLAAFWLVPKQ